MKKKASARAVFNVLVGLFYETVVVMRAGNRADATVVLRKALDRSDRAEAKAISLMNHVALVYWSDARRSHWYRSSTGEPGSIHEARVPTELRASVPTKEPTRADWITNASAGQAP